MGLRIGNRGRFGAEVVAGVGRSPWGRWDGAVEMGVVGGFHPAEQAGLQLTADSRVGGVTGEVVVFVGIAGEVE